jgi:uncharacterized membrane protein
VLLPVLLVYLLFAEALEVVVGLATPIANLFPAGTFDQAKFPVVIALILIVGASFLIGLALRSKAGRRLGGWLEKATLCRLPGYNALKNLTRGFAGARQGGAFKPALLVSPGGERELAYVIEDHGDGQVTVLLPWSPTAFTGPLKIVDRGRVELLNVDLGEFTKVLSQWGVGVRDLLDKSDTSNGLRE